MDEQLRRVAALQGAQAHGLRRAPIGPPPRMAWLPVSQLVIDGSYQRSVSRRGLNVIRKLVETWDWNHFKPLSVAPVSGEQYEVVDGQHTAIAAVTHGAIELLPCLIVDAATRRDRAADFVAINTTRTNLTPYAIFRASVVAGDQIALDVQAALDEAGAQLVEKGRLDNQPIGSVGCPSTLLRIVREKGRARLTRVLKAAIAGGLRPIGSQDLLMLHGRAAISSDAQLAALAAQCL